MKTILIILGILILGGGIYFFVVIPMMKRSLAEKIHAKYSGKGNYDASVEGLLKYDIKTLKGLLDGSIK